MDVISGVLALLVLFGLGWLVTKSKFLSKALDAVGLALNWLWGTLFVGGGAWALFTGYGIWIPLLSIGVGIYFFTTSRFDAKVAAVGEGAVEAVADAAVEKLLEQADGPVPLESSPLSEDSATATHRSAPSWFTFKNVLAAAAILGIAYGLWGLQGAGESTTTIYYDGTVSTDTSYGSPVAWVALVVGGAAAAMFQAVGRREKQGQATPELKLDRRAKMVLVSLAAVGVLLVGGWKISESVRAAWSHKMEGDYARLEAEGIAEAEAESQAQQPVVGSSEPSDDTDSFISYVEEQGGSVTLNASDDPESDHASAVLLFMTSAEPFFEWRVPLNAGATYAIGDRSVDAWDACEYVRQQENGSLVDITSDGTRIVSITVKPAVDARGEEVLTTNRAMMVSDLLFEAPSDGSIDEKIVVFSGDGSSRDDGSVWFEFRAESVIQPVQADASELGACYVDGKQVSQDEFLAAICSTSETRGGVAYASSGIVRSWLGAK